MARGKRAPYTSYLECHFKGQVVYLRYKALFRKDDISKETFEVITDEKTILEAREKGFKIIRLNESDVLPGEVMKELKRRERTA